MLSAPAVLLPMLAPGGAIRLTFCYALQTENHPLYDAAELLINGQTRPGWRIPDVPASQGHWAQAQFDLTEFAGESVALAWRFDTVTGTNNHYRGWHLANVRLSATVVGCEPMCYANCDGSTIPPILNVEDFSCFINEFAVAQSLPPAQQVEHYANCDGSTTPPVLNVEDFTCFINAFAAGCR
jgi:hypothetical protein